jgi:hypothetical protein
MDIKLLLEIVGIYMTFTGIGDGLKYHWQSEAIRKIGLAKGHSRKFINMAIHNDQVRLIYFGLFYLVNKNVDIYLLLSTIFALVFMTELWFTIRQFYPYRCRGLIGFKKPGIITYFINSLLPNQTRKRL